MRPDYSAVEDAISQLAAAGAPTRPLMTAGLLAFGVGVPVYAAALRGSVPGPSWQAAVATGLATLGVAAFPLGASAGTDVAHAGSSALAYASLAATPVLAAHPLAAAGHRRAARMSSAIGVASGLCLVATAIGPARGLAQRIGLTLGDAWLAATAVWMVSGKAEDPQAALPAISPDRPTRCARRAPGS